VLVSLIRPGDGATLGLVGLDADMARPDATFSGFLRRMVPENVFAAFDENGAMLSIIFFALLFGLFLTRAPEPHRTRVSEFFESMFQVVLKMAEGIMVLLPYGVFCLLARVVAKTGFGVFEPLLLYMAIVAAALVIHAVVTLPMILALVGRMSPRRFVKAMAPALMTAFSTSSSSLTLPVTLDTVEKRGRVSNRITSFTLPLGATVNMDGTALYECIGVIFLAQYYASTGTFDLTLAVQVQVVVMALLASIGAAGIPSAGLVMMMTILATLGPGRRPAAGHDADDGQRLVRLLRSRRDRTHGGRGGPAGGGERGLRRAGRPVRHQGRLRPGRVATPSLESTPSRAPGAPRPGPPSRRESPFLHA
jgi:Na+/H+-dicarboxylate symporter